MKPTKEIAILRLVIDLIMADNKIHRDEVSWAKNLSLRYQYTDEDMMKVHDISFCEAIDTLQQLDTVSRNEVITSLREIISIDNETDISERIIITAILMALQEDSCQHVQFLSTDACAFDNFDRQLIYLEQKANPAITQAIKNCHTAISQQLKACDIEFFFYPHIVERLIQSQPHIKPAIEILVPTFSSIEQSDINKYKTSDYCSYIHSMMGSDTEPFRFDAFLMLKIQSSFKKDKHTADFVCIDCSQKPIETLYNLINHLSTEEPSCTIPYHGCYRIFFDMISQHSKRCYNILLEDNLFYLYDGHKKISLNIRGSERKTLFALFLLHVNEGISNDTFALMSKDTSLGKESIAIYQYFANERNYHEVETALKNGKEPTVITNLRDITKRNSHIGYIKRAITSITSLKEPQNYYPQNIRGEHTYNILLSSNKIFAKRHSETSIHPLTIDFFL